MCSNCARQTAVRLRPPMRTLVLLVRLQAVMQSNKTLCTAIACLSMPLTPRQILRHVLSTLLFLLLLLLYYFLTIYRNYPSMVVTSLVTCSHDTYFNIIICYSCEKVCDANHQCDLLIGSQYVRKLNRCRLISQNTLTILHLTSVYCCA